LEFIEAKRADSAKRFGEHPTDRAVIAGKIRQAPSIVNAYWHRLD
jgi:hypothetical protein